MIQRIYFVFLFSFFYSVLYGQAFNQDFNASSSLRSYIGKEKNQFLTISNFANSSANVKNKQLSFNKIGPSSTFYAVPFNASKVIKLSFDLNVEAVLPVDLNQSHKGMFLIGGGMDENWTTNTPKSPSNENVHTRVLFCVHYSGQTPSYSFGNSQVLFNGNQRITIVSNTSGKNYKYTGQNGKDNIVKDGGFDLWIGDELVMNDATAISKSTNLKYFKFVYPPHAPNCQLQFDNMTVESLVEEESKPVIVQVQSVDPKTLWSWQFTFPIPSKGRETAFPSTYQKDGLGEAILSRGFNAAPGSGSLRGFTADFPIDGTLAHAKKSGSYYEFLLTIGKGKKVDLESIDVVVRRQKESPYIYRWAYSLDGKNFVDIGDKDIEVNTISNDGVVQPTFDLSTIAALKDLQKKVHFRMYVWGGVTMTGSERSFGFGKSNVEGSEVILFKGVLK